MTLSEKLQGIVNKAVQDAVQAVANASFAEVAALSTPAPAPKKRGRPKKAATPGQPTLTVNGKRRGRPPKNPQAAAPAPAPAEAPKAEPKPKGKPAKAEAKPETPAA